MRAGHVIKSIFRVIGYIFGGAALLLGAMMGLSGYRSTCIAFVIVGLLIVLPIALSGREVKKPEQPQPRLQYETREQMRAKAGWQEPTRASIPYTPPPGAARQERSPVSLDAELARVGGMDGTQFESYCITLLWKNGYTNCRRTPVTGDQGVDVTAEKDGKRYAIQCKCWSSPVGNKAVMEVYAGKSFYQCDYAAVLTNNYFTEKAVELAASTNVMLWNRDTLIWMIRCASPDNVNLQRDPPTYKASVRTTPEPEPIRQIKIARTCHHCGTVGPGDKCAYCGLPYD